MSEVREYLTEKSAEPREWLRRDPSTTHPEILQLVRECIEGGGFYDDDVERFVTERVGDLPEHQRHGTDCRHALIVQLGHEVYIARRCLDDEKARAFESDALAEGFVPFDADAIQDGARYEVRFGTIYSGHTAPLYSQTYRVRARRNGDDWLLLPPGARSRGFVPSGPTLIREAS